MESNCKKVNKTDKPLEFSDLESQEAKLAAKSIIESVLSLEDPSNEVFKHYTEFCIQIQKKKSKFVNFLIKEINDAIEKQIQECEDIEDQIWISDWKIIENLGKFLAFLDEEFKALKEKNFRATKKLFLASKPILDEYGTLDDFVNFMEVLLAISKDHGEIVFKENVSFLDFFDRKSVFSSKEFAKEIVKMNLPLCPEIREDSDYDSTDEEKVQEKCNIYLKMPMKEAFEQFFLKKAEVGVKEIQTLFKLKRLYEKISLGMSAFLNVSIPCANFDMVTPSYRLYMNFVLHGKDVSNMKVLVKNLLHQSYNVMQTILQVSVLGGSLLNYLLQMLTQWQNKKSKFIFYPENENKVYKEMMSSMRKYFDDLIVKGVWRKNNMEALKICRTIPILFVNHLITSKDYEYYLEEIVKFARDTPTQFHIMCYEQILLSRYYDVFAKSNEKLRFMCRATCTEFCKYVEAASKNKIKSRSSENSLEWIDSTTILTCELDEEDEDLLNYEELMACYYEFDADQMATFNNIVEENKKIKKMKRESTKNNDGKSSKDDLERSKPKNQTGNGKERLETSEFGESSRQIKELNEEMIKSCKVTDSQNSEVKQEGNSPSETFLALGNSRKMQKKLKKSPKSSEAINSNPKTLGQLIGSQLNESENIAEKSYEEVLVTDEQYEKNLKKIETMKNYLKICDLENFLLNFADLENLEFTVKDILNYFVLNGISNDSTEFAKIAQNFKPNSQNLLIEILTKTLKKCIEDKNSKLFEILGIFDFFASLLVVEVANISNFDDIFEILLAKNSKFLKVFFELFGPQFEKFYPENLKKYFEKIEMKLKISNCKILREVDMFRKTEYKQDENYEKLQKVEKIFESLNSENTQEISLKIQKIAHEDFSEFVNVLWKFLLKNPENFQSYLKFCGYFNNSLYFRSQLEDFLTLRRRTFLRISNENFPPQVRVKLQNIQKFIKKLFEAKIVSKNHWNLWNEPHVMVRTKIE